MPWIWDLGGWFHVLGFGMLDLGCWRVSHFGIWGAAGFHILGFGIWVVGFGVLESFTFCDLGFEWLDLGCCRVSHSVIWDAGSGI